MFGDSAFSYLILFLGWILTVVASWKIFEEHGEKGWKAIIPIYSTFILFRIFYTTKQFWLCCLAMFVYIVSLVCANMGMVMGIFTGEIPPYVWIAMFLSLAMLVWLIVIQYRLNRSIAASYGKGIGFTIGLMFFTGIFMCILAFADKGRKSPQWEKEQSSSDDAIEPEIVENKNFPNETEQSVIIDVNEEK